MKKVLTIAGSDCSGGAGIQADLKTMMAHKVYGMSAITSLTAQNTTGVYGISDVTPDFLANELECIFDDIFPDAVKIGMVSNSELIRTIADKLKKYKPKNIVLDPAKQMILDLKGKILISGVEASNSTSSYEELIEVLKGLGYKEKEIKAVVVKVNQELSLEEQVKEALKLLLK